MGVRNRRSVFLCFRSKHYRSEVGVWVIKYGSHLELYVRMSRGWSWPVIAEVLVSVGKLAIKLGMIAPEKVVIALPQINIKHR